MKKVGPVRNRPDSSEGLSLDAFKAVCKDIKALLLYPGFIGVSPAAETSCYMDLIPFLEGGKIVTGLHFPPRPCPGQIGQLALLLHVLVAVDGIEH